MFMSRKSVNGTGTFRTCHRQIDLKFPTWSRIESTCNVVYSISNEITIRMIANTLGFSNRMQF